MSILTVCVGEGIGNMVETLPLIKALTSRRPDLIEVLNLSRYSYEVVHTIFKKYAGVLEPDWYDTEPGVVDGRIELATTVGFTGFDTRFKVPLINDDSKQNIYRPDINEIDVYLEVARDMDIPIDLNTYDIDFDVDPGRPYDIIVHNGCTNNNISEWSRKVVPNMGEVIATLKKKYTIGSIGSEKEYCGGDNLTGRSLEESIALIKAARFVLTNDSGMFHIAAGLKKPGCVIFTATSIMKNYHPIFHRTFKVVKAGVPCQPCQFKRDWMLCSPTEHNKWSCTNIPTDVIIKEVENEFSKYYF